MYSLWQANIVNKKLRDSHLIYQTSYVLGIYVLVIRPNTRYTPEH